MGLLPDTTRRRTRAVLTATVLLSGLGLAGCQASEQPDATPASPGGSSSTGPAAGTPSEIGDPEPLSFGDHPLAQPCSLLSLETVEDVVGPLGPETSVSQEYLDRTLSQDEVVRATDTVTRSVTTQCTYHIDAKGSPNLTLTVDQYRSVRDAEARFLNDKYLGSPEYAEEQRRLAADPETAWIADLDGNDLAGEVVAGEPRMLYVPGFARWESWHDNVLLTFSYSDGGVDFDPQDLAAADYRRQLPWARKVFAGAVAAMEERATQPVATRGLEGPAEAGPGAPYLDPCEVLDVEVFEALHGRPDNEPVKAESLPLDPRAGAEAAFTGSVPQECSRRHFSERQDYFADLTVRTAPESGLGVATLDKTLAVTYYADQKKQWKYVTAGRMQAAGVLTGVPADTGTDVAYILDNQEPGKGVQGRTVVLHLVVGPYVVELDATTGVYRNVDDEAYAEAGAVIVENIERLAAIEG